MGSIGYIRNISGMLARKTFAKSVTRQQSRAVYRLRWLLADFAARLHALKTDVAARVNCKSSLQRVICLRTAGGYTICLATPSCACMTSGVAHEVKYQALYLHPERAIKSGTFLAITHIPNLTLCKGLSLRAKPNTNPRAYTSRI